MDWTLEVVALPVTDVDRAKHFYRDRVGFNLDHDDTVADDMRVVQLTPPGSGCSIVLGPKVPGSVPGSVKGLQLVVSDIEAARAQLVERGVEVTEVQRFNADDGGRVRVLQRSRWQRLGGAGDPRPRLTPAPEWQGAPKGRRDRHFREKR